MSSKQAQPAAEVAAEVAGASEFQLSLDEFCTRLSGTDRRVELIGAFHSAERAAGRSKDYEGAFAGRFVAFVNQPA